MKYIFIFILLSVLSYTAGVYTEKQHNIKGVSANQTSFDPTASLPTPTPTMNRDSIEDAVNDWRVENKIKPLKHNFLLCGLANLRLEEVKKNWSHDGFQDKLPQLRNQLGYTYLGENLARNVSEPEVTIISWENSPTHKDNLIEPNYTDTCVSTDGNYVVQIYAAL